MLPDREHDMSEFLRRHGRLGLVPIAIMTLIFSTTTHSGAQIPAERPDKFQWLEGANVERSLAWSAPKTALCQGAQGDYSKEQAKTTAIRFTYLSRKLMD